MKTLSHHGEHGQRPSGQLKKLGDSKLKMLHPFFLFSKMFPATYYLFKYPMEPIIEPNHFYTASGEIFFAGVAVAWLVTLAFEPDVIAMNQLKRRIGYNNVCVGFDMPPASYLACPILAISVVFGCVYVFMDTQRGILQKAKGEITEHQYLMTKYSNLLFALSLSGLPLIMVITPEDNVWAHLSMFLQHIIMRFIVTLANFNEAPRHLITPWQRRWIMFSTVVTVTLPTLLMINFFYYDYELREGAKHVDHLEPIIPWYITFFFDMSWFFCLATTSMFMPPAPHLKIKYALVTDEELQETHDSAVKTWKKTRVLASMALSKHRVEEEVVRKNTMSKSMDMSDVSSALTSKDESDSRL